MPSNKHKHAGFEEYYENLKEENSSLQQELDELQEKRLVNPIKTRSSYSYPALIAVMILTYILAKYEFFL